MLLHSIGWLPVNPGISSLPLRVSFILFGPLARGLRLLRGVFLCLWDGCGRVSKGSQGFPRVSESCRACKDSPGSEDSPALSCGRMDGWGGMRSQGGCMDHTWWDGAGCEHREDGPVWGQRGHVSGGSQSCGLSPSSLRYFSSSFPRFLYILLVRGSLDPASPVFPSWKPQPCQ